MAYGFYLRSDAAVGSFRNFQHSNRRSGGAMTEEKEKRQFDGKSMNCISSFSRLISGTVGGLGMIMARASPSATDRRTGRASRPRGPGRLRFDSLQPLQSPARDHKLVGDEILDSASDLQLAELVLAERLEFLRRLPGNQCLRREEPVARRVLRRDRLPLRPDRSPALQRI